MTDNALQRAAMLPLGWDPDGGMHLAWPSMLYEPAQAASHLFGNGGEEFWQGPQNALAAQDMREILLSIYGGNALAGTTRRTLAKGAFNQEITARAYRGSPIGEAWTPEGGATSIGTRNPTYWASDNPDVAAWYAGERGVGPNIVPSDVHFKNPFVVDAQGQEWTGIPWGGGTKATDTLAELARKFGHDGLVVRNVRDSIDGGPLGTTYAALRPGTVRSALNGSPIYSLIAPMGGTQALNALSPDTPTQPEFPTR
jgi:hypothetical protein